MFNLRFPYKDRVSQSDDSDHEDAEGLLHKEGGVIADRKANASKRHSILLSIASHFIVFIVALGIGSQFLGTSESSVLNKIQHWSSIKKDIRITYEPVRFNGSFLNLNVYRQDAGPEVDKAWEDLGVDYRALAIPVEDAKRAGLTEAHVQINPKYGGGYPANVEGLHHLHCLNLVRKSLVWNFDYYKKMGKGAFTNEDHIVKKHVTHCIDIIRQQLMCTVDTGVLGQIWWGTVEKPNPFVDFNTVHQCKNYEDIRSWAEARQLPAADTVPGDFLVGPDPSHILPEIP